MLKGATGFLYGFTAPGGIINFVAKRPLAKPFFDATVGYTGSSVWREHVDTGSRFFDNKIGVRLNAVTENGRFEALDTGVDRHTLGLTADALLSPTLKLDADVLINNRTLEGFNYAGSTAFDVTNTRSVGGYTTFDLGARYGFSLAKIKLIARLNLDNPADRRYYLGQAGTLVPGTPRTVKASISASFL